VVVYTHRFLSMRHRSPAAACADESGLLLRICCFVNVVFFHFCYGFRFFVWRDKVIWSIKCGRLGIVSILNKIQQYSHTPRRYRARELNSTTLVPRYAGNGAATVSIAERAVKRATMNISVVYQMVYQSVMAATSTLKG
jgi:hypothetical protein